MSVTTKITLALLVVLFLLTILLPVISDPDVVPSNTRQKLYLHIRDRLEYMSNTNAYFEMTGILLGKEVRKPKTPQEKIAIIQQTMEPGMNVSHVARLHGIQPSLLFKWKKQYHEGTHTVNAVGLSETPMQWLKDNGSAYTAHETRRFTRELNLEPCTTAVFSKMKIINSPE